MSPSPKGFFAVADLHPRCLTATPTPPDRCWRWLRFGAATAAACHYSPSPHLTGPSSWPPLILAERFPATPRFRLARCHDHRRPPDRDNSTSPTPPPTAPSSPAAATTGHRVALRPPIAETVAHYRGPHLEHHDDISRGHPDALAFLHGDLGSASPRPTGAAIPARPPLRPSSAPRRATAGCCATAPLICSPIAPTAGACSPSGRPVIGATPRSSRHARSGCLALYCRWCRSSGWHPTFLLWGEVKAITSRPAGRDAAITSAFPRRARQRPRALPRRTTGTRSSRSTGSGRPTLAPEQASGSLLAGDVRGARSDFVRQDLRASAGGGDAVARCSRSATGRSCRCTRPSEHACDGAAASMYERSAPAGIYCRGRCRSPFPAHPSLPPPEQARLRSRRAARHAGGHRGEHDPDGVQPARHATPRGQRGAHRVSFAQTHDKLVEQRQARRGREGEPVAGSGGDRCGTRTSSRRASSRRASTNACAFATSLQDSASDVRETIETLATLPDPP